MIYDVRKLRGNGEVTELKRLLSLYKEFDKLDIIIDLALQNLGISRKDFKERIVIKKEQKRYKKINTPPQSVSFCDGDKCELPVFMNSKC